MTESNITKHNYKTYNGENISSYIFNGKIYLDKIIFYQLNTKLKLEQFI